MEKKPGNSTKKTIKPGRPHWSEGLLKSMKDPKVIVLEDELIVAIYDSYPKATFHYLVLPKEDITALNNVEVKHLKLLKHMHKIGEKLSSKHENYNFLLGYHSVPSMVRLHLHVISDDFNSSCLKTHKHWNSFNTNFFKPSHEVISELERNGKLALMPLKEAKLLLKQPLKCHKCEYLPKNLPDLKCHLNIHMKKKIN